MSREIKLICFDFDKTMVKGHFHSYFYNRVEPNISEPGVQTCIDGKFTNILTGAVSQGDKGASLQDINTLLQDEDHGPNNPIQLRESIRTALNMGHKVAITSFTLFPEVVIPTLEAIGLSRQEIEQIYVVGGFPRDNDFNLGKIDHIQEAMKHFAITNKDNVMLVDDTNNNLRIAKRNGFRNTVLVASDEDYFVKINAFINGSPHQEQEQNVIQERNSTHRHRSKSFFSPIGILSSLLVMCGLYSCGMSIPILIMGGAAIFLVVKLLSNAWESFACQSARRYQAITNNELSPTERRSFQAGVAATKSYRGTLSAWLTKETYSQYNAYIVGKHLAENANDNEVNRISRNAI